MTEDHNPIAIVLAALTGMASALWAALMPAMTEVSAQAQEVLRALDVNVMDDARLRLVCLAGSVGGALLSVLLFPLPKTKPLVGKLFASGIAGMMFTPLLVRWAGVGLDTDTLLACSGVVAMLSYSVLQAIVPTLSAVVTRWVGSKTGAIDTSPYDVEDHRPHAPRPADEDTQILPHSSHRPRRQDRPTPPDHP